MICLDRHSHRGKKQFWTHSCHRSMSVWWAESSDTAVTTNISMSCHRIHLSELAYFRSCHQRWVSREMMFLCSSLKLKANMTVNPPMVAQSEGYLHSSEGWGTVRSKPFCKTTPRLLFIAEEKNWRQEEVTREGVHLRAPCHPVQCKTKALGSLWTTPSPCPTAFQSYFVWSYTLQHQCWTTASGPCFP